MPTRSVSSGCLSRQVSSRLSRNCRNERRFDIAPQRVCDRSYDEVNQTLARTAVFLLNGLLLAVGLQLEQRKRWLQPSAGVPLMFLGAGEEETEMDGNYVFLCGVMWCRFGQQDAGKELLRATNSVDPDMKALAWAMLAKGARRLRDLERRTPTGSRAILEGNLCG